MHRLMIIYSQREGETLRGKEVRNMKTRNDYIETTMEAKIEEALAKMEANGEKLPEIRYGEKA